MTVAEFFEKVSTEEAARAMTWKARFSGKEFVCPHCSHEKYYAYRCEPEIRKCRGCSSHVRLRVGTVFENTKVPMLLWVRAIFLAMQGKRGVSAMELQRQLKMSSYGTAWTMLHRIREGLRQKDEEYKLRNVIELDGAVFGRRETGNQTEVLVAVESKDWVDEKGRQKSRAGFAKVMVAPETKVKVQEFIDQVVLKDSFVNTDGKPALQNLKNVDHDSRVVGTDPVILAHWLPWVHKFISNAKAWVVGTHHGVNSKYLGRYLSEYTYRFNRRHDPNGLFHRALTACAIGAPTVSGTLFG
jgi:transposase-like protein